METTYQFKNQNVLEHGLAVHAKYKNLFTSLENNNPQSYIPELVDSWDILHQFIRLPECMELVHVYHDCGKPFCCSKDEEGKQHFPNHAEISAQIFKDIVLPVSSIQSKVITAEELTNYVKYDMYFHSTPMPEIRQKLESISGREFVFYCTLWLTSYAEVIANKQMFDDDNQVSFKIKQKKLAKILKILIKLLKEKEL